MESNEGCGGDSLSINGLKWELLNFSGKSHGQPNCRVLSVENLSRLASLMGLLVTR
jgi:hypothetical protein